MQNKQEEVYKSYNEFHRAMFPNDILTRLYERLSGHLGIADSQYHCLVKSQENPRTGFMRVNKPNINLHKKEDIEDMVREFYRSEDFNISEKDSTVVVRDKEKYSILTVATAESWMIYVCKTKFG